MALIFALSFYSSKVVSSRHLVGTVLHGILCRTFFKKKKLYLISRVVIPALITKPFLFCVKKWILPIQ